MFGYKWVFSMSDMRDGSVKELWRLSSPMMVSFFSMMSMIFADRLFLSWYSIPALNAAVKAGTLAWGMNLGWITMATMSEVFVSQFNGAKKFKRLGEPVWQMLWLSGFSLIFFIPLAIWGGPLFYGSPELQMELTYFRIFCYMGPLMTVLPALSGFYIGQGKASVIKWLAISGNLLNIILDPIFIFGVDGFIPSMGIAGAGLATVLGYLLQVVILFAMFLSKRNQEEYGTKKYRFNKELFGKCIKVGLSPSIFIAMEVSAWALFYYLMTTISDSHIFIASVCQSILILFFFFGLGLEKGTIALSGNLIGAGLGVRVKRVFRSGLILTLLYTLASSLFLLVFPDFIINFFITQPGATESSMSVAAIQMVEAKPMVRIGLAFTLFFLMFENIRMVINGILTAAGDTFFILAAGAVSVWLFLLAPTYFLVVVPKASMFYAFAIWVFYGLASTGAVYWRFMTGKWQKKDLINRESDEQEATVDVTNYEN